MKEVVIVTSSKDSGGGIAILDLATCTPVCHNFKNCIAEPSTACLLGSNVSSFSGNGSSSDYIAVAQSKKTCINIYQWGKPQVLFACHVQEIISALASDHLGRYLCAGSKKGWCTFWELSTGALLQSFQAHFKAVTKIEFTACGGYCVTASEDGMARIWEVAQIIDQSQLGANTSVSSKRSITPYR
jgi:pre-rRNA-processing protein IPI3